MEKSRKDVGHWYTKILLLRSHKSHYLALQHCSNCELVVQNELENVQVVGGRRETYFERKK